MKSKIGLLLLSSILSSMVNAEQLNCKSLLECIQKVSKSSNQQYTIGTKISAGQFQEVKFSGSKEDIDKLLSQLLFTYGYTRVPSISNSWMVIASRDIRYNPTPILDSAQDSIPDSYDYILATVHLKNKLKANNVTRSFRPFMSRYGRIISMEESGKIVIQDTGVNIKRLIKLLELTDHEPTEAEVLEAKKNRKFHQKLQLIKAKHPKCEHPHSKKG